VVQTRDEASKQLQESKKTGEAQWAAAQKQYQKATPSNQKASKKTWDLAQKARDEVSKALSLLCTKLEYCDFLIFCVIRSQPSHALGVRSACYCIQSFTAVVAFSQAIVPVGHAAFLSVFCV
jgi:hypothetical protein